ncbi:DUF2125 domain-containing protein [Rhodobacter ferrooxidans]|uniref:DUF2125 domain-containing protein n=1 Tax=Rhodobacter ferrooxidans TaxID=371731 RepID=C8S343_9RHOB|nr:DUF2125 domain-containing protein [Rhodobacter sp. SW2]EEW24683.1 conserved hypothetical protein [Rhodobacter sp. SW2]
MRRLLAWGLGLAVAWSGLWFAATLALQTAAEQWFASQAAQGMRAQRDSLTVQGFPGTIDLAATGIDLANPATGIGWQAPSLSLATTAWWPWQLTATLPATQTITAPGETITLTSDALQASTSVAPGLDLRLDTITLSGTALDALSNLGWHLAADQLDLTTTPDPSQPNAYALHLHLTNFAPDPALLARLQSQPPLPAQIETMQLEAIAAFTAPLDRHAETTRPGVALLTISQSLIRWGTLSLTASGSVQADANGRAEGRINLTLTNWRTAFALAQTSGLIKPELAPTIERALTLLSSQSGDPETLALPLAFQQGRMSLGPLPLGPAPRLN